MKKLRKMLQLIDIGANLVDPMYQGIYNQSKKHEKDLNNVLCRSFKEGVEKIIITGTSLSESQEAIDFAKSDDRLYATVGCHPTNSSQIVNSPNPAKYITELKSLITENRDKVVAIGEIGLDYDRLHYSSQEIQIRCFEDQLTGLSGANLPLFLHCRAAASDVHRILEERRSDWTSGVVHSFTGTLAEAEMFLKLGLFIGINGCSLKTKENLEVVKEIPIDRMLLETDSPWCEIRPSHAGFNYVKTKYPAVKKEKWEAEKMVKGRNEPCTVRQVLEVVAALKEKDPLILGEKILDNTKQLFFPLKN